MTFEQIANILMIDPDHEGTLATDAELDLFELRTKLKFSQEHRQFLKTVANGGFPRANIAIPAEECFGGAGDLDGIYGVGHPNSNYDMEQSLQYDFMRGLVPMLVPFGYDNGGGHVFIDMWERPGRVVYTPWDELVGDPPVPKYHSGDSITDFFEKAVKLTAKYAEEDEE
jgi:hypothetical protein